MRGVMKKFATPAVSAARAHSLLARSAEARFCFDEKDRCLVCPQLSKAGTVETLALGVDRTWLAVAWTSPPTWKSGASERTLNVSLGLSLSHATRGPSACEIGARTVWGAVEIGKSQRSLNLLFHIER
jgi:hypothetical protein